MQESGLENSQGSAVEAPLDIERLRAELNTCAVGHTLEYYRSIESTMAPAHALAAQDGVRSGALVVADEQSAGRGRLQRQWDAPFGRALLVSIALRDEQVANAPLLPIVAGLAVLQALERVGLPAARFGLKWPNDIVCGERAGRQRKVGGIIVESVLSGSAFSHAVLGIGLNVNQQPDELPHVELPSPQPISLLMESGSPVDRTQLLIELCQALAEQLAAPAAELLAAWRERLWTLGREVSVHRHDGSEFTGIAVSVTESGALIVETREGVYTVDAGDVSLRPLQ